MPVPRKPDAREIQQHLAALKAQPWLGEARTWWPKFVFRFEPLETAVTILEDGCFLSRANRTKAGKLTHDAASPEVIAATAEQWKDYVRLYFRPRSPTQHSSEGFRPAGYYKHHSCCPMPIVFLLDAEDILTRADSIFSNGNLAAAGALTGNTAKFLSTIPFKSVYHDSALGDAEKRSVIFHRHAEVVVPERLELDAVRFIGVRTQAEYETLLHLLTPAARKRWATKIGLGTRANLHNRGWMFVEQVLLTQNDVTFRFNPSASARGPFKAQFTALPDNNGKPTQRWRSEMTTFEATLRLTFPPDSIPTGYVATLKLDDRIAYANRYAGPDVPF